MNTDSVEECMSLFQTLNGIYQEDKASLILCYKSKKDSSDLFSYRMSDISNTYEIDSKTYPSVTLPDKSKYRGDYSDFDSSLFFSDHPATIDSVAVRDFNETYLVSESLKDSIYLLNADDNPNQIIHRDNIISRIEADL